MRSREGGVERGGAHVLSAILLALVAFAGKSFFGILLCIFIAWKLIEGSRTAYWVVSLVAFGFGLLQLRDVATGAYSDQFLSDRIFAWARSLCGLAVAALLWFSKDVRMYLEAMRKAGKDADDVASHGG